MNKDIEEKLMAIMVSQYEALKANYDINGKRDYDAGKVEGFKIAMEEIQKVFERNAAE